MKYSNFFILSQIHKKKLTVGKLDMKICISIKFYVIKIGNFFLIVYNSILLLLRSRTFGSLLFKSSLKIILSKQIIFKKIL